MAMPDLAPSLFITLAIFLGFLVTSHTFTSFIAFQHCTLVDLNVLPHIIRPSLCLIAYFMYTSVCVC